VSREEGVKNLIISQGDPAIYTKDLKEEGFRIVYEVSSIEEAKKCEEAGADAVIARSIESGGINGRQEIGTSVLVPMIADSVKLPVIACGGIVDGRTFAAALALGAEGVQIGTRFAATWEAECHEKYKETLIKSKEKATVLINRKHKPIRLLENHLTQLIIEQEEKGASPEKIIQEYLIGSFKAGMKDGDITKGALIAGQGVSLIKSIKPAKDIIREMLYEVLVISDHLAKHKPEQTMCIV
jgi:enoyl-[acyl-carrier protein] reductase II